MNRLKRYKIVAKFIKLITKLKSDIKNNLKRKITYRISLNKIYPIKCNNLNLILKIKQKNI